MAGESRHERPVRRGRVDDTGGDVEGGQKLYYHLTLLAENDRGLPQPHEAVLGGLPRGLLLQAARRLGAARATPQRPDRHHRLPGRRRAPGAAGRRRRRGRGAGGAAAGHLRARQPLRRAAGPRHRRPTPDESAADRDRPAHRRAAARHQRQPLHAPRRRRGPRRAPVRPDRRAALGHQPLQVRGHRALPQVRGRDAPPLPRRARGVRQHAPDRRAGRRGDRARQAEPARVPGARRVHRRHLRGAGPGVPAPPDLRGRTRSATATPSPPGGRASASTSSSASSATWVSRLLPRGLGPHPLRPRVEHPGRARAAARPPAAASPTACASSTSTRSATTSSSSAS